MVTERMRRRQPSRNGGAPARPGALMEEYPFASVTVMFGLGLGTGFVLGHTLAEASGRKMFQESTLAEKLTCQIRDALKNSLPEQLAQYV